MVVIVKFLLAVMCSILELGSLRCLEISGVRYFNICETLGVHPLSEAVDAYVPNTGSPVTVKMTIVTCARQLLIWQDINRLTLTYT